GFPYCTGALVARDVVVTAAHCVEFERPDAVFFGSEPGMDGYQVGVAGSYEHPGYDPLVEGHDVAVVLLSSPVATAAVPLLSVSLDRLQIGAPVRLIGFGTTDPSSVGPANRQKHQGTAELYQVAKMTFDTHPAAAQPCMRDSGGPALA